MKIDISSAIAEVLLDKGAVIIPGLGELSSFHQSAAVDYVKGIISPPSRRLEFNPNRVLNDGVLTHFLQNQYQITAIQAETALENFLKETKTSLEQRDIVLLPKVGRFYTDHEKNIRFLPDDVNFNPDSFGLPEVQLDTPRKETDKAGFKTPTLSEKPTHTEVVAAQVQENALENRKGGFSFGKWAPWVIVSAAILLAFTVWYILQPESSQTAKNEPPKQEQTQVQAAEEIATPGFETEAAATVPAQSSVAGSEQKPANTLKECIVIIHSFGVEANARKFSDKLGKDGYTPETIKVGPLFRVGVKYSYSERSEVEKLINDLGRKYDAGPVVFGEEENEG